MKLTARWRYYLEDAVDEWRHSPGVNLLALATGTAALFLAGLAFLAMQNVQQRVEALREDVPMEIFLHDAADPELVAELIERVRTLPGVQEAEKIDKAAALEQYRAFDPTLAGLVDELGENPLPESIRITPKVGIDPGDTERRVEELAAEATTIVEVVKIDRPWLDRVDRLLSLARWGLAVLGAIVLGAVVLVMASVLRLAVYARRDEIEIMQLVGATPGFVRGPFLVAGLFQGLFSAGLALLGLEVGRRALLWKANSISPVLGDLLGGQALALQPALGLITLGVAVSLAGAFFAVRRGV